MKRWKCVNRGMPCGSEETAADTAGKESSMNPYIFVILALALVSVKPTVSLSATKRGFSNGRTAPHIRRRY